MVRVAGFAAYFVSLKPELQAEIVSRAEATLYPSRRPGARHLGPYVRCTVSPVRDDSRIACDTRKVS